LVVDGTRVSIFTDDFVERYKAGVFVGSTFIAVIIGANLTVVTNTCVSGAKAFIANIFDRAWVIIITGFCIEGYDTLFLFGITKIICAWVFVIADKGGAEAGTSVALVVDGTTIIIITVRFVRSRCWSTKPSDTPWQDATTCAT